MKLLKSWMSLYQQLGVGAIALLAYLNYTPILRAETAVAIPNEENQPVRPGLALAEMLAPAREKAGSTKAIDTVEIDSVSESELPSSVEQASVELLDLPEDLKEEEIEKEVDERINSLSKVSSKSTRLPTSLSRQEKEALQEEEGWLYYSSVPLHEVKGDASPLTLVDNRAELLPPLQIVDALQEDNLQENAVSDKTNNEAGDEDWPSPIHDNQVFWLVLVDELEYRFNDGTDALNWDVLAWVGGDYQRLWIETEGESGVAGDGSGEVELQLLYGQLVSPFWDFQAGVRYDRTFGPGRDLGRAFAVVGIQGLTPYLFEVDAALFISEEGDVSARFEAEYSFLLTQRLILQPELEVNIAAQQVEAFGVGSGLNDIELSLRLRYEVSRQFAPYVGVSWTRKFGQTADFAREEGESTDNFAVVGGLRLLF